ncbi:hypothetical protein FD755_024072 [Muntiacus reevesi]|uniref:Charged multivesicular body protein 3 n=1 Tax=Muntiacus reevesi TaxID=9886 RepID=A0A5N3VV57_MUNRE|nr:hypothetical protein FD755_024072 [Muntiacus reevesi]
MAIIKKTQINCWIRMGRMGNPCMLEWACKSSFDILSDIQREEEKVKRSVKDAAKKGQKDVCVVLAKEMIRSRKAVSKLYASKAHMNSVLMGMKNQLALAFILYIVLVGELHKSKIILITFIFILLLLIFFCQENEERASSVLDPELPQVTDSLRHRLHFTSS